MSDTDQQHDGQPGDGDGSTKPRPSVVDEAANGGALGEKEMDELTSYFLGSASHAPGTQPTDYLKREVNIGTSQNPRYMRLKLRPIEFEEWQLAGERGRETRQGKEDVNAFRRASYVAAYAMVEPELGKLRMNIPEEYADPDTGANLKRPADTAELLRRFFRRIPGALIDIENEVLKASKLLTMESSVREVDAAGN